MIKKNAIFVGDALFDGGNDAAVKRVGIDCIEIGSVDHTKKMLARLAAKKLAARMSKSISIGRK